MSSPLGLLLAQAVLGVTEGGQPPAFQGVVSAVTPGGAEGGTALVAVTANETTFDAPYLAHYTPAVGHVVLLARTQPPVILGRVIGTPPD